MTAARFASGFQKSFTDLPGLGGKSKDRLPYDELMVEAAAYCHYLLSREFPSTRDDDFDEDSGWDDPELDSTWDVDGSDACATALFYSQALLAEHLPAGYTSDFLERRWLYYHGKVLPREERDVAEFFSSEILSIISERVPSTVGREGLILAAKIHVPIFHQTHVAALRQMTHNLFENADALLLELSEQRRRGK